MGARPTTPTSKPKPRGDQQAARDRAGRKLNRSEQQAIRIRAAANAAARLAAADDVPAEGSRAIRPGDAARRAPSRAGKVRAALHVAVISRAQEMAFIRADLRRMLITAAVILVAMFVLLAVLPT